jgi:hypothetical protein
MFSVLQSLLTGYKKVLLKGFGAYTTQFQDVLVEVNLANYSIISMACSMICWHIHFLISLVFRLLRSSEICNDQCKLGFPFGHTVPCSYTYTSSEGVVKKHISALKNCGCHTLQILECIDNWFDLYSEARSAHLAIERIKSLHSSYLCVWIARHYLVSFNEERRRSQFISLIFFSNWAGICQVEGTNALWISKLKMGDGILRITTLVLRSFVMGKAHRCRTFLKCEARLGYHLILGPLFWESPTMGPCVTLISTSRSIVVINPKHWDWWKREMLRWKK